MPSDLRLELVRREVDEAMRVTTETLSQVTDLLAIVSAPPIETDDDPPHRGAGAPAAGADGRDHHLDGRRLQARLRLRAAGRPRAGRLGRLLPQRAPGRARASARARCARGSSDPSLPPTERAFLEQLTPAFTELAHTADTTLYFDGAARLLSDYRFQDVTQLNALLELLERRVSLLGLLTDALSERDIYVRIGAENAMPALRSLSLVAANYGLPQRNLGTVSVVGPTRMDYRLAITTVREAAHQLSRFIEDVYEEC